MEDYEAGKQEDVSPEERALHKHEETDDRAARTADAYSRLRFLGKSARELQESKV